MFPQAKKHQQWPASHQQLGETWIRSPLTASEGTQPADTLNSPPASRAGRLNLLFKRLSVWYFARAILVNNTEASQREERTKPLCAPLSHLGSHEWLENGVCQPTRGNRPQVGQADCGRTRE